MKTETIYSEFSIAGSQPLAFAFSRESKAGRGVGKLYNDKNKGRFQPCSD